MSSETPPGTVDRNVSQPADEEGPRSALATARRQLDHAAAQLDIDPNIVECLKYPTSIYEVAVAVQGFGSVGANAARLLHDWGRPSSLLAT